VHTAPVREGEVIADKFRIGRRLGEGGMGVVMAAIHLELDAPVALKFLLRNDEAFVERFLREARAAARLSSEHVTRVLDVGRLPSGAPYVVMEYLEGETIAEHVARVGRVPLADALDWLVQTCAGLSEAHAAGIVHRDIKPANLFLVRRPDGTARVKILDFGVAKVIEANDPGLTTPGSVVGSPSYASPEQLVRPAAVDHRADIWALGVTLYGLVAGELPFSGDTIAAKYMRILGETPARVDALVPDVPRGLADAIERCLAKEPGDRYQDVASLAAAIAPFAPPSTQPTAARLVPASTARPRIDAAASDATLVDDRAHHEETTLAAEASPRRGRLVAAAAVVVVAIAGAVAWYARAPTEAARAAPATSAAAIVSRDVPPASTEPPSPSAAPASASAPAPGHAVAPSRSPALRGGRDPRSYR
jgi:serine/threonine protein kinase